jgi:hypothetical protein
VESGANFETASVNIVRDFLDYHRDGHKLATELFARNGSDVDLAIAAQGHRLDATGLLGRELHEALARGGIGETRQLAYLSEATYPSEDLFPGQYDRALRAMCGRLHDEHQIPVVAMTVREYFESRTRID